MISLLLAMLFLAPAPGCLVKSPKRNAETLRAFQRAHPCPSTGKRSGACPGYQKHHIWPLCCGGPDDPANLVWVTEEQHRNVTQHTICKGAKR